MTERVARRTVEGTVVSDKMQKTIVVVVERSFAHPMYGKTIKRQTRIKVHDEEGKAKVGDWVEIAETRPLSKGKNFRLVEVLKKAGA